MGHVPYAILNVSDTTKSSFRCGGAEIIPIHNVQYRLALLVYHHDQEHKDDQR